MSVEEGLYRRAKTRLGKVGVSTKFYQALGAIPDTLKTFSFGTLLLFYYNQVLGLQAVLASVAISAALILDAVLDPLIGSWSDNLRSRLGRRHPLMYASATPLGLGLYLTFSPPTGIEQTVLAAWLFATVVVANVSMSVFTVPWTALYAELSDDYSERTQIVTWRFAVGWCSALILVFLTWTFIFPSSPAFTPGQLNPHGYKTFALLLGGVTFVAILLTTQLTLREIPYLLQPTRAVRFNLKSVLHEVRIAFGNRDFVALFLSALVSAGVLGTLTTLGLYLQTYFWGLGPEQLRWFGFAILGAMLAFVLIGWIERRLDKKRVLLVCFAVFLVDGFVMIGLRLLHLLPPNGAPRLITLLVLNEIGRTFLSTVVSIMFISMLADTLDLQELRTGRRQEGVFAAALTFSGKVTAGVGAIAAGLLLEGVIHWPTKAPAGGVAPGLITSLGVVAGMATPLLLLAPLLLILRYRITRQGHEATRAQLDARRAVILAPSFAETTPSWP